MYGYNDQLKMKEVLRPMENFRKPTDRETDQRTRLPKEARKSSELLADDPRLKQIEEINKLIVMKSKIESTQQQDEYRRRPKDETPWVDLLHQILTMPTTKKYTKLSFLGDGTYSTVNKVKNNETKKIYAMKKFRCKDSSSQISLTTLREIKALMSCSHPNIIQFIEICVGHRWVNELALVMECGEIDLLTLMRKQKNAFELKYIKSFLYQALSALHYLHQKHIMHRDIKLSNFILTEQGDLKLIDFGLARGCDESDSLEDPKYTPTVATLWYRAPELLLGDVNYTTAVDLWAIGCVHAELLRSKELFPGRSDIDQLSTIFSIMGTPTESIWPGFSSLPVCQVLEFTPTPAIDLKTKYFSHISSSEFQLLSRCLTYDPKKRISAAEALQDIFFTEFPLQAKFIPL